MEEVTVTVNGTLHSLGAVSGTDDRGRVDETLGVQLGLSRDDILRATQAAKFLAVSSASHHRSTSDVARIIKDAVVLLIIHKSGTITQLETARDLLVAYGARHIVELPNLES